MESILTNKELLTTLIATVATIIPALLSIIASFVQQRYKTAAEESINLFNDAVQNVDDKENIIKRRQNHLNTRMNEVASAIKRYNSEARIQNFSNGSLVFGQYVVGIALTSSFLQESLTPTWIGILGLIVLLTTVVHQKYRPDLKARVATLKANLLKTTIRKVQDDLSTSEDPEINKLIWRLTQALNKVEIEEIEEWVDSQTETHGAQDVKTRGTA